MTEEITLAFANRTARMIEDALDWYAENADEVGVSSLGEDRYTRKPGMVRASEFSSHTCPKLASAMAQDVAQKNFSTHDKLWFLQARFAAMMAKRAIHDFFVPMGDYMVYTEEIRRRGHVECTTDALLNFTGGNYFPIEIKWTSGVQEKYVEQTIANMYCWDANYGFLLCLPSIYRNDRKVYTVGRDEDADCWRLYDGIQPANIDGISNVYTDGWFDDVLNARLKWRDTDKFEGEGPFIDPSSRPCAEEHVPAQYYKRNSQYGRKGERKPNTGYIAKLCPLFGLCYKDKLEAADIPIHPSPARIDIEDDGGNFSKSDYSRGGVDDL